MKDLIIKDILNLKRQAKLVLVFAVLYGVMSFYMEDASFVSGIIIFMCAMFSVSSFAYDDMAKWDKYALSMPLSRKDIVMSKYILIFILALAGALLSFVMNITVSIVSKMPFNPMEKLLETLAIVGISLIFTSVLTPLIYKFGTEKARILIILVFVIPAILFSVLANLGFQLPSEGTLKVIATISPIIIIAIIFISYLISLSIYRKKEM